MEKKRIEYIDAMRGFTMILVVLNHIAGFCLNIDGSVTSLNTYFYEFRMPLFFFVSGFVLYKSGIVWNLTHTAAFLRKKFPVQIVSTCIFFLAFTYVHSESLEENVWSDSKGGYWFTYVLFIYFVLYSLIRMLALLLKLEGWKKDVLALLFGGAFFVATIPSVMAKIPIDDRLLGLLSFKHWCYFVFFIIGTVVKKRFDLFQRLLDGRVLLVGCLTLFFGLNIFREPVISVQYNMFRFLTAVTGIIIIFSFFRSRSALFSTQTTIGKGLCYIGRRTLDIYFLHYFLLPLNLSEVVTVFSQHPMPVLEFFVSSALSLIVIAVCLIISNVLRLSPLMGHWLFGVKLPKPSREE